jgi:hypothetical protein
MANEFEAAARAKKVSSLLLVIDRLATDRGLKPHGEPEDIEAVIEFAMRLDEAAWRKLSEIARLKNPPSETTIGEVLHAYQRRAELANDLPF